MTPEERKADVAAVLPLDDIVDAVVVRTVRADAEVATNAVLAALSDAGIRCLYVPEGVEVEHGARLDHVGWACGCARMNDYTDECPLSPRNPPCEKRYAIEPPRQP